jgi:hypothetical protein
MSNTTYNRVGFANIASTPTSYNVEYLKIVSNSKEHTGDGDKKSYDITANLAYFSISESISGNLIVDLSIGDSGNFVEYINLQGNEKLELKVSRNEGGTDSTDAKGFMLDLRIQEILNYQRPKPGLATFNITAVSEFVYLGDFMKLKIPFYGSPTELISKISTNVLKIENGEYSDSSKNIIEGIYPNIKPMDAIYWLMSHAFDAGTPHFYYQTLAEDGKVHLKSYKQLTDLDEYEVSYTYSPFVGQGISLETKEGYLAEKSMIRRIQSDYNQSKLADGINGAYVSTLHTLDIANKSYKKSVYQYNVDKMTKLNDYQPFSKSENSKIDDKFLDEFLDSKSYYMSTNSQSFFNSSNYSSPIISDLQKATSHLENLNYQSHKIQVAGDFDLSVGKKIRVDILKTGFKEVNSTELDSLQSGVFIITHIDHIFNQGFFQELTIQRDSSEVDLDATS